MSFMITKNIAMAINTIRTSRGRSFLTMLGVIVAVASVTTVVSVGRGIQGTLSKQTTTYSKGVLTIRPAQVGGDTNGISALANTGATVTLSDKDADAITKIPNIDAVVPMQVVAGQATGDSSFKGPVFAVSSDLPEVINQQIAFGAFFTSREDSNSVAVLGSAAADQIFDQKVPLGRSFTINGQQFIVAGVLAPFASTPFATDANFNNSIFVPSSAAQTLSASGNSYYQILAHVHNNKDIDETSRAVTKALNKVHHGDSNLDVLTPEQLAKRGTSGFNLIEQFIIAAAIITMIVSGIGIMNVMLVSVTERIHEIGIRKAVGATNQQIMGQFVTEAAALCLIGSVWGAILALVIVGLMRAFTNLQPVYDWRTAGISCLVACLFGLLFGTVPAVKAARKDPITALRSSE